MAKYFSTLGFNHTIQEPQQCGDSESPCKISSEIFLLMQGAKVGFHVYLMCLSIPTFTYTNMSLTCLAFESLKSLYNIFKIIDFRAREPGPHSSPVY